MRDASLQTRISNSAFVCLTLFLVVACSAERDIASAKKKYETKIDVCSASKELPNLELLKKSDLTSSQLELILRYQYLYQLDLCLNPEKTEYLTLLDEFQDKGVFLQDWKVINSDQQALAEEANNYQQLPEKIRAEMTTAFNSPFDPIRVGMELIPLNN